MKKYRNKFDKCFLYAQILLLIFAVRIVLRARRNPLPPAGTDIEQQIRPRNNNDMKRIHAVRLGFTECNFCSGKNDASGTFSGSKLCLIQYSYDALGSRNNPVQPSSFMSSSGMITSETRDIDACARRD